MKKKFSKFLKQYIFLILTLAIIFIALKFIAYSLPEEPINRNIEASLTQLEEEGVYPQIFYKTDFLPFVGQKLDNYTDAIFLNTAYSVSKIPLLKAIAGDFRMAGEGENPVEQFLDAIKKVKSGEEVQFANYGRQWFGGEVIIRPLLIFFNYPQIRILLQYVFILLLIITSMSIQKNISTNAMWAFVLGLLCANVVIIPSSLNLFNSFLIVVLGALFISKIKNSCLDYKAMFVIGSVTAYLDLFATPFVTYTVLVQVFLMKKLEKENFTWKEGFIYLVKISIAWLTGYLILWGVKWALASLLLSQNYFVNAFNEMKLFSSELRPSWGPDTSKELIKEALKLNFLAIFPINMMVINKYNKILFGIALGGITAFRIFKCQKINYDSKYWLFVLAASAPYVWYIVVHVHSFVHFWFQYRLQTGTIIGLVFIWLKFTCNRNSKISKKE